MSENLSRRAFLRSSVATAAVAALPAAVVADPAIQAAAASRQPMPAWAVGTPGDWNWQVVRAPTEAAARRFWCWEAATDVECEMFDEDHEDFPCGDCASCVQICEVQRQPTWDGVKVKTGDIKWFEAGFGTNCHRCGEETTPDDGLVVGDEVVCHDCMTVADWWVCDPEYAAERFGDDTRPVPCASPEALPSTKGIAAASLPTITDPVKEEGR